MQVERIINHRVWRVICITWVLMLGYTAYGQLPTNFRSHLIATGDSVKLDTLSVIPGSVVLALNGVEIPKDYYVVNYSKSEIYFDLSKMYKAYGNQMRVEASY